MNTDVFEVVHPGPLTTVQDTGRHGFQQYGVPVSGAMDDYSHIVANILCGNDENAACLETTLAGLKLRVLATTIIAVTGGDFSPVVNTAPLCMWRPVLVQTGDVISFPRVVTGCRAYLAVRGGIDVPLVMGSRSTCVQSKFGGLEGRPLRIGDKTKAFPASMAAEFALPSVNAPAYMSHVTLRVIMGPQDDRFLSDGINTFLDSEYTVTPQSDRTGYRLTGPRIQHKGGADIISDGIPAGSVQVPGDGLPIVLMADRPTTGGYAKIATVISVDISLLAQAKPGNKIRFVETTMDIAQGLYRERAGAIRRLLAGNRS